MLTAVMVGSPFQNSYELWRRELEPHPSHLQAVLSKLLTYCVLRPTQPPTLSGKEMSSSLQAYDWTRGAAQQIYHRPNQP